MSPNWITDVFKGPMQGGPEGRPVTGNWVIQGLEQGQGYQARLQAKNRYGWSDYSDTLYFFAEPKEEKEPEPSQQSYVEQWNRNLKLSSSSRSSMENFCWLKVSLYIGAFTSIFFRSYQWISTRWQKRKRGIFCFTISESYQYSLLYIWSHNAKKVVQIRSGYDILPY